MVTLLVQSLTKLKNGPKVGTRPCKFCQALLGLITPAVNGEGGGRGEVVMRFSLLKAAERVAPGFNNKEGRRGSLRVGSEAILLPASLVVLCLYSFPAKPRKGCIFLGGSLPGCCYLAKIEQFCPIRLSHRVSHFPG